MKFIQQINSDVPEILVALYVPRSVPTTQITRVLSLHQIAQKIVCKLLSATKTQFMFFQVQHSYKAKSLMVSLSNLRFDNSCATDWSQKLV